MKFVQFSSAAALVVGSALVTLPAHSALVVTPLNGSTVTPTTMANSLLAGGSGITINSINYTGANGASGLFSGGSGIIGFDTGIVLTSGSVDNVVGPNTVDNASRSLGLPGDASLNGILPTGQLTFDASVLEIRFTPNANKITFSYVFGSEEYNEFINDFNDVFGFFVNGTNVAQANGVTVSIDNVNCGNPFNPPSGGVNCSLYRNNDPTDGPPSIDTQLDGLTVVLSIEANVNANVENILKLAIADTGDERLDSAVFIAGGSFQTCGAPGLPDCDGGGDNGGGDNGGGDVPEPVTLALLGVAGVMAAWTRRKGRR